MVNVLRFRIISFGICIFSRLSTEWYAYITLILANDAVGRECAASDTMQNGLDLEHGTLSIHANDPVDKQSERCSAI